MAAEPVRQLDWFGDLGLLPCVVTRLGRIPVFGEVLSCQKLGPGDDMRCENRGRFLCSLAGEALRWIR